MIDLYSKWKVDLPPSMVLLLCKPQAFTVRWMYFLKDLKIIIIMDKVDFEGPQLLLNLATYMQ